LHHYTRFKEAQIEVNIILMRRLVIQKCEWHKVLEIQN